MRTIAENANDFVDLRTADGGNCVYVDKTDYFHRLVTAGSKRLFFIARPRRFGKSLMITTFKYIFEGRREFFKGLEVVTEDTQSAGRADIVVKYRKAIFVFELKRDGTAAVSGIAADKVPYPISKVPYRGGVALGEQNIWTSA